MEWCTSSNASMTVSCYATQKLTEPEQDLRTSASQPYPTCSAHAHCPPRSIPLLPLFPQSSVPRADWENEPQRRRVLVERAANERACYQSVGCGIRGALQALKPLVSWRFQRDEFNRDWGEFAVFQRTSLRISVEGRSHRPVGVRRLGMRRVCPRPSGPLPVVW